jgi:hypothetical protein
MEKQTLGASEEVVAGSGATVASAVAAVAAEESKAKRDGSDNVERRRLAVGENQ